MADQDLYSIAADAAQRTYSEEYVTAALNELAARGATLPEAHSDARSGTKILRYSSSRQRQLSQRLYWLALAFILLTALLVIATIWHAHHVQEKIGGAW